MKRNLILSFILLIGAATMAQSRVGTDLVLNSIDNEAHSLFGDRNIVATVKNVGINPINSFDIQYQVNNGNTVTENVTYV